GSVAPAPLANPQSGNPGLPANTAAATSEPGAPSAEGLDVAPTFDAANQALAESIAINEAALGVVEAPQAQGFMHFIQQSDLVGKSLFVILVVMSFISWYIIVTKGIAHLMTRRRVKNFLASFWRSSSLEVVEQQIQVHGVSDPFSHLTKHALQA